jgi:hypothetical protein
VLCQTSGKLIIHNVILVIVHYLTYIQNTQSFCSWPHSNFAVVTRRSGKNYFAYFLYISTLFEVT